MSISKIYRGNKVLLPEFSNEQIYMQEINISSPWPKNIARWEKCVKSMLEGIKTNGHFFITIDQSKVSKNSTHRKPGAHIDGAWEGCRHHVPGDGRHRTIGSSNQIMAFACNILPGKAYIGEYFDNPKDLGDCSHMNLSKLEKIELKENYCWYGNAMSLIHEGSIASNDCYRTLVRLNINN